MVNASGTDNSFFPQIYYVLTTISVVGYATALESAYSRLLISAFLVYAVGKFPIIITNMIQKLGS